MRDTVQYLLKLFCFCCLCCSALFASSGKVPNKFCRELSKTLHNNAELQTYCFTVVQFQENVLLFSAFYQITFYCIILKYPFRPQKMLYSVSKLILGLEQVPCHSESTTEILGFTLCSQASQKNLFFSSKNSNIYFKKKYRKVT